MQSAVERPRWPGGHKVSIRWSHHGDIDPALEPRAHAERRGTASLDPPDLGRAPQGAEFEFEFYDD